MQAYSGRPGLPRAGVRKLPAVWSERGEDADFWQKSGKCMEKEKRTKKDKIMEEKKNWKAPGALRPLSDTVAQTPLREKYDKLLEMARLMMERPDGVMVIYIKMTEINQRRMRPGEAEIWQAADEKNFKRIRQLAEALLDEDSRYGWGYLYLVMAECKAESPVALSKYIMAPDGLLVCQEEPEGWHEARRSYKRAQRFADESLQKMFALMEDINKSLLLCKKAETELTKKNYEAVLITCIQMPFTNFAGSEQLVDKAVRAIFNQCKEAEFNRIKELDQNLEKAVRDRHPAEYGTWNQKNTETITANLKRHGAKKPTFWLALLSLVLSPLCLRFYMPVSLLFLGFAWETTRDDFHLLRGFLTFMGLGFVTFLIGEPLGIFSSIVHLLIVTIAIVLGSLWFLKCGQIALKFNKLYDDLIPYDNNVIKPLNDAIREELAAEYETVPGVEAQLGEWSKWYQW